MRLGSQVRLGRSVHLRTELSGLELDRGGASDHVEHFSQRRLSDHCPDEQSLFSDLCQLVFKFDQAVLVNDLLL